LFFGSFFITFGPAAAIFALIIAKSPRLIILTIGGSFFWLLSILISSIWWYIIPPLRQYYWWTILWSVMFQEIVRFGFIKLYAKAEKGFIRAEQTVQLTTHPDQLKASLALGLGTGMTHAFISYVSLLWEAMGPGNYFSPSCPSVSIFPLSAFYAFCFILLHTFWFIVAFSGFKQGSRWKMAAVVITHYFAAFITMLNLSGGSCVAAALLLFILTSIFGVLAWLIVTRSMSINSRRVNQSDDAPLSLPAEGPSELQQ